MVKFLWSGSFQARIGSTSPTFSRKKPGKLGLISMTPKIDTIIDFSPIIAYMQSESHWSWLPGQSSIIEDLRDVCPFRASNCRPICRQDERPYWRTAILRSNRSAHLTRKVSFLYSCCLCNSAGSRKSQRTTTPSFVPPTMMLQEVGDQQSDVTTVSLWVERDGAVVRICVGLKRERVIYIRLKTIPRLSMDLIGIPSEILIGIFCNDKFIAFGLISRSWLTKPPISNPISTFWAAAR